MNYKLLMCITDYIILFPIKWYNLIKKIVNNATVYNNVLIISKNSLYNLKQVYQELVEILSINALVYEISENIDFHILYFNRCEDIMIFKYWLNLIVVRACLDLNISGEWKNSILSDNFYFETKNIKIYINQDIADNNNIYITTKKVNQANALNFEYNYFNFCKQLKELYHLQNM